MIHNPMDTVAEALEKKISTLPSDKIAALEEAAVMEWNELVAAQNAQSRLFALGRIAIEIAQWAYTAFGGEAPSSERFKKLPLAKRLVAVNLAVVLIKESMSLT